MTIIIEKGVELAPSMGGKGRSPKYPFSGMVNGDSFFVPCGEEKIKETRQSLYNCARYQKIYRIAIRVVDGGLRVWCISREAK